MNKNNNQVRLYEFLKTYGKELQTKKILPFFNIGLFGATPVSNDSKWRQRVRGVKNGIRLLSRISEKPEELAAFNTSFMTMRKVFKNALTGQFKT